MKITSNNYESVHDDMVSIIVPAYNHDRFVEQSIRSVWDQDYPFVELVVIDDGSQDGTGLIIDDLCEISPIPMMVVHKHNEGVCKTLNEGVGYARGRYIGFLASDDYLEQGALMKSVNLLEQSEDNVIGCYGNIRVVDENDNIMRLISGKSKGKPEDMLINILSGGSIPQVQSCLFKKDYLDRIGYFDNRLRFEDIDFMLNVLRSYNLIYHDNIVINYRDVQNSLGNQVFRYDEDFEIIINKHLESSNISEIKKKIIRSNIEFRFAAIKYCNSDNRNEARSLIWESIAHWPFNYRAWVLIVITFMPWFIVERILSIRRNIKNNYREVR